MNRLAKSTLLLPALFLVLQPDVFAQEGRPDGEDLLRACRSAETYADLQGRIPSPAMVMDTFLCIGYLAGFTDAISVPATEQPDTRPVCLPDGGIQGSRAIRIVVGYLETHPELLHLAWRDLVLGALRQEYPC